MPAYAILFALALIYTGVFLGWAAAAWHKWKIYRTAESAREFLTAPIWPIIAVNHLTKTIKEMLNQLDQDT